MRASLAMRLRKSESTCVVHGWYEIHGHTAITIAACNTSSDAVSPVMSTMWMPPSGVLRISRTVRSA